MSLALPAAPPQPKATDQHRTVQRLTSSQPPMDECQWALHLPELQKACYLARVCSTQAPRHCQYYNITGMLQDGPTCGLIAISMLLGGSVTPTQLLAQARQLHYSNNGEMFSARYLYELLCLQLPANVDTNVCIKECSKATAADSKNLQCNECQLHEGQLNCSKVKEALRHGACLLVPYPFFKKMQLLQLLHNNTFICHRMI